MRVWAKPIELTNTATRGAVKADPLEKVRMGVDKKSGEVQFVVIRLPQCFLENDYLARDYDIMRKKDPAARPGPVRKQRGNGSDRPKDHAPRRRRYDDCKDPKRMKRNRAKGTKLRKRNCFPPAHTHRKGVKNLLSEPKSTQLAKWGEPPLPAAKISQRGGSVVSGTRAPLGVHRAHYLTAGLDVLVVEPSTLISQPDRPSDDDIRLAKANRIREIWLRLHHHVG
ncbi:hypothetical protein BO94DRAFT_546713 [Aspergillus sclerotioniger CBS 115572]|uniref:Uncharacterized protein n=1 Tax=Aspergillus sclerotioniger CBS 115572 TaxID=1450535 RepID=A0A317WN32_9EURO|nr:hypothetical protein BO94DRAFT_546713 [Aspergillus sclerotioniger CBS 115572]PWY86487.1 hypothetical protein BO94DRAFT_546713 [Aspergillus sclerotioniger CBS 115572]